MRFETLAIHAGERLAELLGGVASLAKHPATMSHASMPEDYRKKVGITDELIRLSVGLENIDDLIEDLSRALELG
jgi:cystathionine beta-lyase